MKNIDKRIFLIFLILLVNCDEPEGPFDPTYFLDGFKGITFTDEFGFILKIDPNDWCFPFYDLGSSYTIPKSFSFYPAYPNPVTSDNSTTFQYSLPKSGYVEIVIKNNSSIIIKI